jgi:hypothetical protein
VSSGPVSDAATLVLDLSQFVIDAGATITVAAQVLDSGGGLIVPAPGVTFEILFNPEQTSGVIPGINDLQIVTDATTRGSFEIRGTVNGTAVTSTVRFAVVQNATQSPNSAKYATLASGIATSGDNLKALADAVESGNTAAIPAINAALLASRDAVNLEELRRSTAVTPDTGFLPTLSQLTAAGYPQTAADVTFTTLVPQINSKLNEIITFYDTLNPAAVTDDEARLNQLNAELTALQTQLASLNVTAHGIVRNAPALNNLLANTFPRYLHAVVDRTNAILVAEGLASSTSTPDGFYEQLSQPSEVRFAGTNGTKAFYEQSRPAFFGLVGLVGGSSLQMNLVNRIYGPLMAEVSRWMVLLVIDDILTDYANFANMIGIRTGGSLSFHAYGIPGSDIEMIGAADIPLRNDVYLVGPAGLLAAQEFIESFIPSDIESLQDVYDFFEGIKEAADGAVTAAQEANQLPDSVENGCLLDIFDEFSGCKSLVYDSGFTSVRQPGGLAIHPVLVISNNLDTGAWASFLANFTGG